MKHPSRTFSLDLEVDFAVGKLLHHGASQLHAQRLADFLSQRGIRISRKYLQAVVCHLKYRLCGGHVV